METEKTNGHDTNGAHGAVVEAPPSPSPPPPTGPAEFCSPTLVRLAVALAKAQIAFQPIERTRTVTVRPKEKPAYSFSYAPLDVVLAATMPALNANGLALVSLPMLGGDVLRTLLLHESGEFLAIEVRMPVFGGVQEFGSHLTYLRRYSIISLLGVASEEDDDGNAGEGNQVEKKTDRPSSQQQPMSKAAPPLTPPRKRPWMEKLQAVVGKLNLGEAKAAGLKGKAKDDVIRDERIAYLCWCAGRRVVSTLDLTDEEADLVIRRAELGEVPQ